MGGGARELLIDVGEAEIRLGLHGVEAGTKRTPAQVS